MSSRIYISSALAASSDLKNARLLYENIADELRHLGYQPYLPHKKTDPVINIESKPTDVFEDDIDAMFSANYVLAILDEPSHGVGAEIALAANKGIPIIAVWQSGKMVSRFIRGFLETQSSTWQCPYETNEEIAAIVSNIIQKRSETLPATTTGNSSENLALS
ncbi:nucleoside 2-deoxyribosyltransferase [Cerasicoccus frondis]|uniref:nucleoside 2-deoxyribosyltransferase n=1 Tax=Cerasicoccus frondis TaxID=490090 RepID=UPI002852B8A2|nr:nucleoside 2-deoxyribosyltransferase [Cerasicoccus frondis]